MSTCCTCQAAKKKKAMTAEVGEHISLNVLKRVRVKKIQFNVFSDEIWTGELNYSPVCAASSDDNIVPSRPEIQNTKRYFCRVGNCQRSTPLSCLCMHREHQRLVSDPQMDDLNVTLARPQRQSGKETLRIVREEAASCAATPNFSVFHSFALSLCLSFHHGFVSLILLSHSLTLSLFCPLSLPPCLSVFLSITLFLSLSLSLTHTHTHTQCLFPLPFSLMISPNGREANSAVALNEKWQAIAAAHSHRYVDANNKTQRLDFTTGDFGLLF